MQPREPFILFASDTTSPDAAAEALRASGYRDGPLVLALPSTWCQSATIDLAGLPRSRDRRRSWTYRLEEKLPLAAEDVTADMVPNGGTRSLGVCVATDRVKALVASLEGARVRVQTIAPAALLAAQSLQSTAQPQMILLRGSDGSTDVVATDGGRPVAWAWIGASTEQEIRLQFELASSRMSRPPAGPTTTERSVEELATAAARRIVEGRLRPWIDLRRGALAPRDRLAPHRRALNFALASAAMLLLSATVAAAYRATLYHRAARDSEAAMAGAFRQHFPGWPVPANVRAVVESELRKKAELGADGPRTAVASMRALLAALPAGVRVSVDSMAFDPTAFEMSGRVNGQADVEAISAAARATGFDVNAPQSRREADGTWSFTVSGNRRPAGGGPS